MKFLEKFDPVLLTFILASTSVVLSIFILSLVLNSNILLIASKIVFIVVLVIFLISSVLWILKYITRTGSLKRDLISSTNLSISGLLSVIFYAFGFFYITFFGKSNNIMGIFSFIFILAFIYSLIINVVFDYRVFSGKIRQGSLTFVNIIPSIVMAGGIILSSVLVPDLEGSEFNYLIMTIVYLTMMGFGISIMQFLFISTSAFHSYLSGGKPKKEIPFTMLPVGGLSMFVLNFLLLPDLDLSHSFQFPEAILLEISIMIWGAILLYLIIALSFLVFTKFDKYTSSLFAYVFPVGIADFATYLLWNSTRTYFFKLGTLVISFLVFLLYSFALIKNFSFRIKINSFK